MISGASDEELDIANARADLLSELQPEIDNLKKENQKYKEVIDKAMSKLGRYADELTGNGNAYAVCVDLLDILKEVE